MNDDNTSYWMTGKRIGAVTEKTDAEKLAKWMHDSPAWAVIQFFADNKMIYALDDDEKKVTTEAILNAPWDKTNRISTGGRYVTQERDKTTAHELWIVLQFLGVVKDVE